MERSQYSKGTEFQYCLKEYWKGYQKVSIWEDGKVQEVIMADEAKKLGREKPAKIEQKKVRGLEWGPQVEQTAQFT